MQAAEGPLKPSGAFRRVMRPDPVETGVKAMRPVCECAPPLSEHVGENFAVGDGSTRDAPGAVHEGLLSDRKQSKPQDNLEHISQVQADRSFDGPIEMASNAATAPRARSGAKTNGA